MRYVTTQGVLDCPFYARDELGGVSRNFTACFGDDVMHGDHLPPYTCGSQSRRALIKYFYRDYSKSIGTARLSAKVSALVRAAVDARFRNYTAAASRGCLDASTGRCSLAACALATNGFAPCMDTAFVLPSDAVAAFLTQTVLAELPGYLDYAQTSTVPWTKYYYFAASPSSSPSPEATTRAPQAWAADPTSAAAAAALSQFTPDAPTLAYAAQEALNSPATAEEALADPARDLRNSQWGLCAALLGGGGMLTLPLDPVTRLPAGAASGGDDDAFFFGEGLDALAAEVRNLSARAAASGAPFLWHRDRRHVPSRSRVCARPGTSPQTSPHAPARLRVTSATVNIPSSPSAAASAAFTVQPDLQHSFPLFGFLAASIGDAAGACVCATDHPSDLARCAVDASTCATLVAPASPLLLANWSGCAVLQAACAAASGGGSYLRADAPAVLECLRYAPRALLLAAANNNQKNNNASSSSGAGGGAGGDVRCPELGPSDFYWGLFPAGSTGGEGVHAGEWVGTGASDVAYEGARFLHEGRAGLRLPNYAHVNATYHAAVGYGAAARGGADAALPRCYDGAELLAVEGGTEDLLADLDTDALELPATQLLTGASPLVAICTRYLLEDARATLLRGVPGAAAQAAARAASWRRRCGTKVREASACQLSGAWFRMPPPPLPADARCTAVVLAFNTSTPTLGRDAVYLTPWCMVVDRVRPRVYDGRLCLRAADRDGNALLGWADLSDACALQPQPQDLLGGDAPYPMLFAPGARRLAADWLTNLVAPALDTLRAFADAEAAPARDVVGGVLDYGRAVVGYHVTASALAAGAASGASGAGGAGDEEDELAPKLFDSHYLYDAATRTAYYAHSVARNASLLANTLGAAGLCRAPNVGMPLFDANTNRLCTRRAALAVDAPTMPVASPPSSSSATDNEQCAATHDDILWAASADDPVQSGSAGGLPGWQTYATLDAQGATSYGYSVFPPPDYALTELPQFDGWGGCRVAWGAGVPCNTTTTSAGAGACGAGFQCLVVAASSGASSAGADGLCTSALHAADGRAPCFETAHCADGQVCLVDGACAPLQFHVWNRIAHTWPMEFTVLADDCGFQATHHPFTQSTRGATPWEQVPDLLHMHGFCGHRYWFAYRAALWDNAGVCPLARDDAHAPDPGSIGYASEGALLECRLNATAWPWIQQRFDGSPARRPFQSLADGRALLAVPHPCDVSHMHLARPSSSAPSGGGGRMQVCSGFEGRQNSPVNTYALNENSDDWAGAAAAPAAAPAATAQWLRTYDEASNTLHVGVVNSDRAADVPLGFLGANLLADGDVRSELATGGAQFFRCAERMACSNPTYTFGGRPVDRLDPLSLQANFSETSLRLCGAQGYVVSAADAPAPAWVGAACWLDIRLFPLFMLLVGAEHLGDASLGAAGCSALWPTLAGSSVTVVWTTFLGGVSLAALQNSPRALFCDAPSSSSAASGPTTGPMRCAYAARASTRLTTASAGDAVAGIADALNGLLRSAGAGVRAAAARDGATRAYEYVNRCGAQLLATAADAQADLQVAYDNAPGPSGLYLALRVVMYELPIAWLHHAMLVTLLSLLDATVSAPALDVLLSAAAGGGDLFLWAEADRGTLCRSDGDLDARPVLWRLLCRNQHPAHTWTPALLAESSSSTMSATTIPDQAADGVRTRALNDVLNDLPSNTGAVRAYCYSGLAWNCEAATTAADADACRAGLALAYNTTSSSSSAAVTACQAAALLFVSSSSSTPSSKAWIDPCAHPEHFAMLGAPQPHALQELDLLSGDGPAGGILPYMSGLTRAAVDACDAAAVPVDLLRGGTWEDVAGAPWSATQQTPRLPIARAWPLALSSAAIGFDLDGWLRTGVCQGTYDAASVCQTQYATSAASGDACIWPWGAPQADGERYILGAEQSSTQDPAVVLTYRNGGILSVPVCDLLTHTGTCVPQYAGTAPPRPSAGGGAIVPCDIVGIDAPPGVEVQAFAVRLTYAQWLAHVDTPEDLCAGAFGAASSAAAGGGGGLTDAQIGACTWTAPVAGAAGVRDAWWSNGSTLVASARPDLDGFGPLSIATDNMGGWWPPSTSAWSQPSGCGADLGVCAVRLRLAPLTPGVGGAVCVPTTTPQQRAPDCGALMQSDAFAPFAVARGPNHTLYRCGPCTRFRRALSPNPEALFGCYIGAAADGASPADGGNLSAAIAATTAYLHADNNDAELLLAIAFGDPPPWWASAGARAWANNGTTSVELFAALQDVPFAPAALGGWGAATCTLASPADCFAGVAETIAYFAVDDAKIWDNAVANPDVQFTMVCQSQIYSPAQAQRCNAVLDGPRQSLGAFVDAQYRSTDGVWMHTAAPGTGVSWVASVAGARTGMFSLAYASAARPEREVRARWALGDGPCSQGPTVVQDRLCVQSATRGALPFQALHPWLGGDYQPFDGLDACPSSSSQQQAAAAALPSLCPCACAPAEACACNGAFNYTPAEMAAEFPSRVDTCGRQAFVSARVMGDGDVSNLCAFMSADSASGASASGAGGGAAAAAASVGGVCTHLQGLLGGSSSRAVTPDELHGAGGVPTIDDDFLVQDLYTLPSSAGGGASAGGGGALWAGSTLAQARVTGRERYAFLRVARDRLQPAHVAFATADPTLAPPAGGSARVPDDSASRSGAPLLVARVALLPYASGASGASGAAAFPAAAVVSPSWPAGLADAWAADAAWIAALYPSAPQGQTSAAPPQAAAQEEDWRCPLRVAAFWGGRSATFAPVVPAPPRAARLYPGLGGAHLLIAARRVRDALAPYQTSNGGCFYDTTASPRASVPVGDPTHPCGLQGLLRNLQGGYDAPSRVVDPFSARCNAVIDTPDLGAPLRSGETLAPQAPLQAAQTQCGVLHRLTPFRLRTRGDAGAVVARADGTTTRSEGGDCHMGRALLAPLARRTELAGRACALVAKSSTDATAVCPQTLAGGASAGGASAGAGGGGSSSSERIAFQRAAPLTMDALILRARSARTAYRIDAPADAPVAFLGPGGVPLQEPESSFGLLRAVSLRRSLAADVHAVLLAAAGCDASVAAGGAGWPADLFWRAFTTGALDTLLLSGAASGGGGGGCAALLAQLPSGAVNNNASSSTPTTASSTTAAVADAALWNRSDWAWTPGGADGNGRAVGTVSRDLWLTQGRRFDACNASYVQYQRQNPAAAAANLGRVRPISLCEPAPTEGLQTLCAALLQYRADVQNVNCELQGGGACLYRPGAFYVPYSWSPTNQEFAADTVIGYYRTTILTQPRFAFNESYDRLCPQRNAWMQKVAALSQAQATQCPAFQMEGVKDLLAVLRGVGYRLLYMGYCLLMFVGNVLSAFVGAGDSFAADAALSLSTHYLLAFVQEAEQLIMPVLNGIVSVLFGSSTFGQIMNVILDVLCATYNFVIGKLVVPIWCAIVRPALYILFDVLEGIVGVVSQSASAAIARIWDALSGGDGGIAPGGCLGSLTPNLDCAAGRKSGSNNASLFLAAAVATRCWADASSAQMLAAGGSVFGGAGDSSSYLVCTASDTCAADPLQFDGVGAGGSKLGACGACPADAGFGCDPMLKRCTCGASVAAPDVCLTSSDCALSGGAECAVVSDLASIGSATSHLPCSECATLGGMQPACIRGASGAGGTCGCAAIAAAGALQTCAPRGAPIALLGVTGFCLATADVSADLVSPSLVLDFGALAIAPCILGLSLNGCVGVSLPLIANGGLATRALAVIFVAAPSASSYRRRLLSIAAPFAPEEGRDDEEEEEAIRACGANNNTRSRADAKACLGWHKAHSEARALVVAARGASQPTSNASAASQPPTLWELAVVAPEAGRLLLRRASPGLAPALLDALWGLALDASWLAGGVRAPPAAPRAPHYSNTNNASAQAPPAAAHHHHPRRRLLQTAALGLDPSVYDGPIAWTAADPARECPLLDEGIANVASAWADTLRYYDEILPQTDAQLDATAAPLEGLNLSTLLPPVADGAAIIIGGGILADLADAVMLGYGRRAVDALVAAPSSTAAPFSGTQLLNELSHCNYTTLTLGTRGNVRRTRGLTLIYLFAATFLAFTALTTFFIPPSPVARRVVWYVGFPMAFFWAAYGIAPTCWPMVPPRLPHDVAVELGALIPANVTWDIPSFLVRDDCDVRGHIAADGSFDPTCFKRCDAEPFLFASWQDAAAWWLCDFSTSLCSTLGATATRVSLLGDFASSATFFADVIALSAQAPDYVAAFRTCAFFSTFHIVFALAASAVVALALPAVLVAILELFSSTLILLSQASAHESALSAEDAEEN